MLTGIYKVLNKTTGKFYIGSALDIKTRWSQHRRYLRLGQHQNIHLQRAWNKYGETDFAFFIISICDDKNDLTGKKKGKYKLTMTALPTMTY